jgi:sensor histidine kinase YesM
LRIRVSKYKDIIALHLIFWSFAAVIFYLLSDAREQTLTLVGLFTVLVAISSYLNEFLFIPILLRKNKYVPYVLAFVASVFLVAVIDTLIVQNIFGLTTTFWQETIVLACKYLVLVLTIRIVPLVLNNLQKNKLILKLKQANLEAEVSALKSQINPHFLLNTLNNLYGQIIQQKNEAAAATTLQLADLMRYLLESNRKDKVLLIDEIEFIKHYIGLENIRLANKNCLRFNQNITNTEIEIEPFLFLPLVENIFKHAFNDNCTLNSATITLAVQGNTLFFETINCQPKQAIEAGINTASGLKLLRMRLALLYPAKHLLVIEKTENQYRITLSLELNIKQITYK